MDTEFGEVLEQWLTTVSHQAMFYTRGPKEKQLLIVSTWNLLKFVRAKILSIHTNLGFVMKRIWLARPTRSSMPANAGSSLTP